MATLTAQSPARTANALTLAAAAAGGDDFVNTGKETLLVRYAGVGTPTLTLATTLQVDGLDLPNLTVELGAGETHLLGPFPKSVYNSAQGTVALSYSSEADITLAVLAGS